MFVKKWFSVLLLLGFMVPTIAHAYDDDEWYDEEEEYETPKKKAAPKKAPSKKASDSESRIGLSVGFGGSKNIPVAASGGSIPVIGLVYDMGSGMEIGVGLGLHRTSQTPDDPNAVVPDPDMEIALVPSIKYALGKGLLGYGVGVEIPVINRGEAGTDIGGFPFFYVNAELVKNVSLSLLAGVDVERYYVEPITHMNINLATRGVITFFFM
ncbi:MAG: hypothetical protein LBU89_02665 [Fibromonadaceae bacterium]|jgi:hypothetical protein|nr:hypothetical protein [Fibromonadaceae bacterium]